MEILCIIGIIGFLIWGYFTLRDFSSKDSGEQGVKLLAALFCAAAILVLVIVLISQLI